MVFILGNPIDRNKLGVKTSIQGDRKLTRGIDITAATLISEDSLYCRDPIGFCRRQNLQRSVRPSAAECRFETTDISADLIFRIDKDGRSKLFNEIDGIAVLNEEVPILPGQAVVNGVDTRHLSASFPDALFSLRRTLAQHPRGH